MLYEKNCKQLSTPKPHLFIHVFDTALSCLDGFPLVSICNTTYSNSKYDRFILESHPPPLRFIQSALLFLFVCISPFQTLSPSLFLFPTFLPRFRYICTPSLPPSLSLFDPACSGNETTDHPVTGAREILSYVRLYPTSWISGRRFDVLNEQVLEQVSFHDRIFASFLSFSLFIRLMDNSINWIDFSRFKL